tara:strand:+ start:3536 stop:4384 length:849 start_codon:yes stop_codon:yes gene_type:complete
MSKLFVNTIAPNSGDTVTVSGSLTTTGKLTIGDATSDTVAITAEITSSLIPDLDDTFDLGSSGKQWKDLYIDGTANIDALAGVNTATITTLTATQLKGGANDHIEISSSINISGSIQPNKDDTYDLGSSVRQWKDLYVDGVGYIDQIDQVLSPSAIISNISGSSISASTNLYVAGALKINKTTGASVDANTYSANGTKVEVRTQLQAQLNDGTFAHFYLLNTSVATDSIIVGSFTGGTAGAITASLLSANPIAASTASFRIHNETGGNVADNTGFTASFVIL